MNSSAPDILPPAKRMKSGKAEISFFFDGIPKEVIEIVLRYFSRIPNAKKWEIYIDVRILVDALGFSGGFGTYLKSRFHTLVLSRTRNCFSKRRVLGWKEIAEPYLWTNDIAVAHAFVVAGGGEALRTLVISRDMYKRGRDGENLVDDFRKRCPNVTSLSIAEEGDTVWTQKFGGQLKILEVRAGSPINIPGHTPALRELNMSLYSRNSDTLRRIGGSLERLVISGFIGQRDNAVDNIKLHCPKLKSISLLAHRRADRADITRLLASYGHQLEYALLFRLTEHQINYVAIACPKARFHVSVGADLLRLPHSSLNLIGPRFEWATIYSSEPLGIDGGLAEGTNVLSQCVNLRHLELHSPTFEDVQAIFSTPKPNLDSVVLHIRFTFEREDMRKMMTSLTNGTKRVEKLELYGPPYFIDELYGFIERNRATLSYIELGGTISAEPKKLDEFLQSFLELPALEELYVDYDIQQDTLRSLRNIGVYCGRKYL